MSENRRAKKLIGDRDAVGRDRNAVGREAPMVITPSGLARLVAQTVALIRKGASRSR